MCICPQCQLPTRSLHVQGICVDCVWAGAPTVRIPELRRDDWTYCERCDESALELVEHRAIAEPLTPAQVTAAQPEVEWARPVEATAQVLLVEVLRCACGAEALGYLAAECVRCGALTECDDVQGVVCGECKADAEPVSARRPAGCHHPMGCDC